MYDEIDIVEFDLNTTCNSFCPTCHRYAKVGDELYLSPYVNFNENLDIEVFRKVLQHPKLNPDVSVDLVGLVGEPVAHPQIFEIIDIVKEYQPDGFINLHTNGGLKTEKFWAELGERITYNRHNLVRWSIDGLADTNHIYRQGVNFEKVMRNLKAFIGAGGRADWQFVDFPWNRHQQEEARQLAKELGIRKFFVRKSYAPEDEMQEFIKASNNAFHKTTRAPEGIFFSDWTQKPNIIEDRCITRKSIYINAHGKVLPCCMVNSSLTHDVYIKNKDKSMRQETTDFLYEESDDWNDLNKKSTLEEIVSNPWWEKLYKSFDDNPCGVCAYSCGTGEYKYNRQKAKEKFMQELENK